jgi:transposase
MRLAMIHPVFIGCDVAKAHLDLFDNQTQKHVRISNTSGAIATWLATLAERDVTVILEATGSYDRLLCAALEEAHRPYCRVNPARARDFAKALGLLAKTDAIDARLLALMGQTLSPPVSVPPDPSRRQLYDLHSRRDQLVAMRQQERTRRKGADPAQHASIESHLVWLDAEIIRIEQACREHVRADRVMREQNARLLSIPGIGTVTAFTLLAHMPELGGSSPKALAALAGLAPFNADSGTKRGQRHIRGGRKRVRDALYMAAFVAHRLNTPFARMAQIMAAKGKPFKVMIIAIARKILVTANALIRDKTMFNPT